MLLLSPLVSFFDWLISKEIEITYKKEERIITSVLTANFINSFNESSLQNLWLSLTNETLNRIYSLFCNEFLREKELRGEFIRRQNTKKFIQVHHIEPRFENGSNDISNRVTLDIYFHGIAHLLRFVTSKNNNDINGVNNSLRTGSEIDEANQSRLNRQREVLGDQPVGRPLQRGHTPSQQQVSNAQRASGSVAGLASQRKNSFKRVNPFTRFVTTLHMTWSHISNFETDIILPRSFEFYTVSYLVENLNKSRPTGLPRNQFHVFSQVLRGDKKRRSGWSIKELSLPNFGELKFDIDIASNLFHFIQNEYLNKEESNSLRERFIRQFNHLYPTEFLVHFFECTIAFLNDSEKYYLELE